MAIPASYLINMLRNVTGRVDANDPLFTDTIMLDYLQKNIALITTNEVRLFKNYTWWEFTFGPADPNPYPVDLEALGFSTLQPPAYIDGFDLFWYESPADFFARWPETQDYQEQRPMDVLYYNQELLFRGPPEDDYDVKISAYRLEVQISDAGELQADYLFRYIVYNTALDIFSDYGEIDRWNEIFPIVKRYKSFVTARTHLQWSPERPSPQF